MLFLDMVCLTGALAFRNPEKEETNDKVGESEERC
jgi:hypothetical protein